MAVMRTMEVVADRHRLKYKLVGYWRKEEKYPLVTIPM